MGFISELIVLRSMVDNLASKLGMVRILAAAVFEQSMCNRL